MNNRYIKDIIEKLSEEFPDDASFIKTYIDDKISSDLRSNVLKNNMFDFIHQTEYVLPTNKDVLTLFSNIFLI